MSYPPLLAQALQLCSKVGWAYLPTNGGQDGKKARGQEESDSYFELTTGRPPLNLPLPMTARGENQNCNPCIPPHACISRRGLGGGRLCLDKSAFTLAETLITLVIIGIVAAVTVPAIINKTNDREYITAKNKVRSSIGEAVKTIAINSGISDEYTTKEFTEKVLSKYLRIGQICDSAKDCGFPEKIKRPDGTVVQLSTMNTMKTITTPFGVTTGTSYSVSNNTTKKYNKPIYLTALDGIHMQLFYNPYCVSTESERSYVVTTYSYTNIMPQFSLDTACIYGAYDMNGTKGPNQAGKDIGFFGTFYNGIQTRAVAVLPAKTEKLASSWDDAYKYCANFEKTNYTLPTIDELSVIYLNKKFVTDSSKWFWSASALPRYASDYRDVGFSYGGRHWYGRTSSSTWVRCVRT